jgi:hypothetical protein
MKARVPRALSRRTVAVGESDAPPEAQRGPAKRGVAVRAESGVARLSAAPPAGAQLRERLHGQECRRPRRSLAMDGGRSHRDDLAGRLEGRRARPR